jgi:hypothetical protein
MSGAAKAAEARAALLEKLKVALKWWEAPDVLDALDAYLDARELHMWEQVHGEDE